MDVVNLGITGASISRCPWLTWVDYLQEDLGYPPLTNYATKGAGNQFILHSASNLGSGTNNSLIAFMLTNFDKHDLWVQDSALDKLRNEKHQPVWVDGTTADKEGYWCTGSHFPGVKKKYKSLYNCLLPIASQQLFALLGTITLLKQQGHQVVVLVDSPILSYTESQINSINSGNNCDSDIDLASHPMLQYIVPECKKHVVDFRGLIGYCIDNNLDWKHKLYGPHPCSQSHLLYYVNVIKPWIANQYSEITTYGISDSTRTMSERMSKKWKNNEF